mmetsp:Transcript_2989/g.9045  ORF Transcript_2989/g.9045 Transcript_2989/m.9045 type:complete len:223 (-) Transcript_2989:1252-1920(-)
MDFGTALVHKIEVSDAEVVGDRSGGAETEVVEVVREGGRLKEAGFGVADFVLDAWEDELLQAVVGTGSDAPLEGSPELGSLGPQVSVGEDRARRAKYVPACRPEARREVELFSHKRKRKEGVKWDVVKKRSVGENKAGANVRCEPRDSEARPFSRVAVGGMVLFVGVALHRPNTDDVILSEARVTHTWPWCSLPGIRVVGSIEGPRLLRSARRVVRQHGARP